MHPALAEFQTEPLTDQFTVIGVLVATITITTIFIAVLLPSPVIPNAALSTATLAFISAFFVGIGLMVRTDRRHNPALGPHQ